MTDPTNNTFQQELSALVSAIKTIINEKIPTADTPNEPLPQEPVQGDIVDKDNLLEEWLADSVSVNIGETVNRWIGTNGTSLVKKLTLPAPELVEVDGRKALKFNGHFLGTESIFSARDDITAYALVKAANGGGSQTIVCLDQGGNSRNFHMSIVSGKAQTVGFDDNGRKGYSVYSTINVPVDDWSVLTSIRAMDRIEAYVNNEGNNTLEQVPNAHQESALFVGARGASSQRFNGLISKIRVYKGSHDSATRNAVLAQLNAIKSTTPETEAPVEDMVTQQPEPSTPAPTPPTEPVMNDVEIGLIGINFSGGGHGTVPGILGTHYQFAEERWWKQWSEMNIKNVRLAFKWERIQPTYKGELDETHTDWLTKCFDWADKYGMTIVLNMHNYMRREVNGTKHLIGTDVVPTDAFIDCWVKIANFAKGHKSVIGYGLMNEPYKTNGTWARIAQQTYDAVNKADPDTDIYVAGDFYSSASKWPEVNPDFPLKGDRIVYEAHSYLDEDNSGTYNPRDQEIPVNRGVERFTVFVEWCKQHNVRGFVGEVGIPEDSPSAKLALEKTLKYLLANKIPVTYFAGGPGWSKSAVLAIQYNTTTPQLREPISLLKKLAGPTTRQIGPVVA